MTDIHSKKQRSYNMSQIRASDTKPEIAFRKYIWGKGIRGYRLRPKIKGKPDLFFPTHSLAVFIDGCFWHRCPRCFVKPLSNVNFWDKKITHNVVHDKIVTSELRKMNINVIRYWEHEVNNSPEKCYIKLKRKLEAANA